MEVNRAPLCIVPGVVDVVVRVELFAWWLVGWGFGLAISVGQDLRLPRVDMFFDAGVTDLLASYLWGTG